MDKRDKMKAKTRQAKGKSKEAAGRMTGNDRMRHEGRADQAKAHAKQTGQKAKDAADQAKEAVQKAVTDKD